MWSNKIKLMIAVLALGASVPLRAEIKVGDAFPALASAGLVCASWCAPCKASFPSYAKLYTDYAPRGLVIVAVSVDEKAADYQGFVKKLNPPFPVLLDAKQQLVRQVQVPTMPTSYLLGRDGKVRYVHQGFHGEATERELRKEIDALLAEKE